MFWRIFPLILATSALVLTGCGPTLGNFEGQTWLESPKEEDSTTPSNPWRDGNKWGPGTGPGPVVIQEGRRRWQPVYFAYDQSTIGDGERPKLDKMFEFMSKNGKYHLLIEGHCDDRGSEEYNRTLSERRALAVRKYLSDRGLASVRLHTLSFGEEKPAKTGTTEEAHRLNRRAELIVLPPKASAAAPK